MSHLFNIPKRLLNAFHAHFWLCFLIANIMVLATLFLGAILVVDVHWSMWLAALVCLAPWLVAMIVLYIRWQTNLRVYEVEKAAAIQEVQQTFVMRLIVSGVQYLLDKRAKRNRIIE